MLGIRLRCLRGVPLIGLSGPLGLHLQVALMLLRRIDHEIAWTVAEIRTVFAVLLQALLRLAQRGRLLLQALGFLRVGSAVDVSGHGGTL